MLRLLALMLMLAAALALPLAAARAQSQADGSRSVAASEHRVALVIGNAAYGGSGALRNPVNDAKDVAGKLASLGFEVILRTDIGQREMTRAITQFGALLKPGSAALFYYAGHGVQVQGRNYLVPVDAEISTEGSVRSEAIDVDQMLAQVSPARLSVVILDACRNNPFERAFRGSASSGLAQIDAPTGTLIAYATAPGKVAADGAERNSPYTKELLRALDSPGWRIEEVFKQVRIGVARATGNRQVPWESSSLTGDFYFRTAAASVPAAAAAMAAPAGNANTGANRSSDDVTLELAFWDSIKSSKDTGDYAAYLEQYPSGRFATLARSRLRSLGASPASIVAPAAVASTPLGSIAKAADKNDTVGVDLVEQWPIWTYRYLDKSTPSFDRTFAQQLVEVNSDRVREQLREPGAERHSETVFPGTLALRFSDRFGRATPVLRDNENLDTCNRSRLVVQGMTLNVECKADGREKIIVPAGEFDSQRIEITGDPTVNGAATRRPVTLTMRAWYDTRSRRLVRQEIRVTTNDGVAQKHYDQLIELIDAQSAGKR